MKSHPALCQLSLVHTQFNIISHVCLTHRSLKHPFQWVFWLKFCMISYISNELLICPFCTGHCKVNSEVKRQITEFVYEIHLSIIYPSMPKPSKHLFLLGLLTTLLYELINSSAYFMSCLLVLFALITILVPSRNYKIPHYMKFRHL